ncbi:MAG TPA: hypothetical protein VHH91_00445 [Vicinamibacterales bacterium]|jgi:hypothetical protein|nr:hypothetical protein [Vicinamibacterales bacterium]
MRTEGVQVLWMRTIGAVAAAVLLAACGTSPASIGSVSEDPVAAPRAAAATVEPLRGCGQWLCTGGTRFRWTGVTAFGLADHIADGRTRDARAFAEWAAGAGFNILRVLAMLPNGGWLHLAPEDGRRALPQVFALAREHGMHVQVVALANTNEKSGRFRTEPFLREQVREVARLCAAAGNCVLEIANEPYHGSQAGLARPELMQRLQQEVPDGLPVAWGAAESDVSTAMAGGTFVVSHVARSGDRWARIARARDLAALAEKTGKFVVDNEPIGAAETPERSRRDSAPEAFYAQGAVSRLLEVGATFHCEDCLRATVPGPVQRQCAEAFVEGRKVVPDSVRLTAILPGDTAAPARSVSAPERVFSGVAGTRAWVLLLGDATRTKPAFASGWRPETEIAKRPGVQVWTAVRESQP